MALLAQIFALLAGLFHVVVFVMESVLFERPRVYHGVFGATAEDVKPMRVWAFNIGFYNLFLAIGAIVGVILWWAGNDVAGRTLLVFTMAAMFLAGCVLFLSDRLGLRTGGSITGPLGQAIPPLIALIALAFS
ncbi:DUF1304 domain-containing protein [Tenggerimyces flavus]|uniref:DUF1304 domain-containing protein n=1 Tax=Tenggerimyces flavus TaxID=1708749 RepID=A0ABV7Y8Z1_9ACTN|nr:DUF1304 domain-containing protein [Tenggerimyces flavus]MBM7785550.1 putative membrane protein [Tenggerimyces flavus]